MKIVISPAKSLDFESPLPTDRHSEFAFAKEAIRIHKVLAAKKPASLRRLMDISDDLARLNWERNQAFSLPFTPENARPAVFAFSGDVYQGLDAYSLTPAQIDRMQDTLRILSGLYGLLKPLDLIQPYRLEMGTSLKVGTRKNLYDFWKKTLSDHLNAGMGEGEMLVNLASNEYFGALDAKRLKANVVTPIFKDWNRDQLRVISFFAKKARGAMVRYILETGAETREDLLGFDKEGYQFSPNHTQRADQPVFVR